ncbi:MAG TPA: phage portal protein, partial [Anaerolineae bacterium]
FTQVIYGVPKTFIAADQLWYRPRHLRADSPYGRTATEDALTAVELLAELWDNRKKWYQEGTIPEVIATAPEGWGPDKVDQFEEAFNLRMAGANTERAGRLRALPYGFKIDQMKDVTWPKDTYEAAFRTVGRSFGIPGSELGLQGGDATSGRAFLDAMQRTWYRQGLAPLKRYIEGMFNDVLSLNGLEDYSFLLDFPQASIDPEKQTKAIIDKFTNGLLSFNEARQQSGDQGVKGGDVWCIIKGGEPVIMNEIFNRTQGQAVAEGSDAGQPLMNVPLIEQPPAQTSAPAPNVIAPDVKKPSGGPNPFASKSKASSFPFKTKTSEDQTSGSTDTSKVLQPELVKYTGVDLEDDLYYRAPLERVARVDFPVQGANETEIIVAAPNGRPTCPVIWKPSHGEEAALQAVIGGEMGPRDEACYLLDRMLGWYLVPVSWMSNLQGERGLAMLYVRGHEMPQPTLKYAPEWQEKAAAFDYLTGQIDRGREATTNSNWLTHPTDLTRPILIDNGYSLPHALLPVDSWFAASFRAGPNRFSDKVMADLRKLMDILPTWPQIKLVLPPDPILQLSVRLEALLLKGGVPDDVTLE